MARPCREDNRQPVGGGLGGSPRPPPREDSVLRTQESGRDRSQRSVLLTITVDRWKLILLHLKSYPWLRSCVCARGGDFPWATGPHDSSCMGSPHAVYSDGGVQQLRPSPGSGGIPLLVPVLRSYGQRREQRHCGP